MRYITAEFWNQINNGQVYVTMDLNGKEVRTIYNRTFYTTL